MFKRTISVAAICSLMLAAAIVPALAKRPDGVGGGHGRHGGHGKGPKVTTTHMTFKLDENEVASGSDVTGTVLVETGRGKKNRVPIAGAVLTVTLDGVDTGTPLVTGTDGTALLTLTAPADGEHNVKVIYAGSDTQRKAQRAQGFTVGTPVEEEPVVEEPPAV
ncbi:MAG: Ig-like domain-containing protein [Actinobacteria bacterium]|nr:Ig-like domain-containing protein [Actinomycetota bacterium]